MLDVQPGVVDEDVDASKLLDDWLPQRGGGRRIGEVCGKERVPRSRKMGEGVVGGWMVVVIVQGDAHATLRQLGRNDSADPARRAGHECYEIRGLGVMRHARHGNPSLAAKLTAVGGGRGGRVK